MWDEDAQNIHTILIEEGLKLSLHLMMQTYSLHTVYCPWQHCVLSTVLYCTGQIKAAQHIHRASSTKEARRAVCARGRVQQQALSERVAHVQNNIHAREGLSLVWRLTKQCALPSARPAVTAARSGHHGLEHDKASASVEHGSKIESGWKWKVKNTMLMLFFSAPSRALYGNHLQNSQFAQQAHKQQCENPYRGGSASAGRVCMARFWKASARSSNVCQSHQFRHNDGEEVWAVGCLSCVVLVGCGGLDDSTGAVPVPWGVGVPCGRLVAVITQAREEFLWNSWNFLWELNPGPTESKCTHEDKALETRPSRRRSFLKKMRNKETYLGQRCAALQ
jgi:hypothetical protein